MFFQIFFIESCDDKSFLLLPFVLVFLFLMAFLDLFHLAF